MTRTALIIAAATLWLVCFAIAMVTIIPFAGMGLAAIFENSFTIAARLQGIGFIVFGVLVMVALLFTLTRMLRFLTKARRAQN